MLLGVKENTELGNGKLNAPGGKLELGETLAKCAGREAWEELNVAVSVEHMRKIGTVECYAEDQLMQRVFVYYTEQFKGIPCATRSMNPEWTLADAVPYERMHEGDRHWFLMRS